MCAYKLKSHTADVRILAEDETLQELFRSALAALREILTEDLSLDNYKQRTIMKKLEVKSYDQTSLLIDFLSDALTLMHNEKIIILGCAFDYIHDKELECTLIGVQVDGFKKDIKAVTYHEAEIIKNKKGNFETMIVLDI